MKLRTNLSPGELRKVGLGLQKLADKQQTNEIELENAAERKLIGDAEKVFELAMGNFKNELDRIMSDKDV